MKAEARTRILAAFPEHAQRNALAKTQAALIEFGTVPAAWPPAVQKSYARRVELWAYIAEVRAASNALETWIAEHPGGPPPGFSAATPPVDAPQWPGAPA